jgi:hypothetical protein
MAEYKLPVEMPALLGASAEIIPDDAIPLLPNHVVDYSSVTTDTVLAGYMVGGIISTAPNIFTINTGAESSTFTTIYKVYLTRSTSAGVDVVNKQSVDDLEFQIYPNPNDGILYISFHLGEQDKVLLTVRNVSSKKNKELYYPAMQPGKQTLRIALDASNASGLYTVTLKTSKKEITQNVVIR